MNGIKSLEPKKEIFKNSLAVVLILFVFTMSFSSSFFQIIKPAEAGTIDGPTFSPSFTIKAINVDDVSAGFMVRKTLFDDTAGHAMGWDPNGTHTSFIISDSDVGAKDSTFVGGSNSVCMASRVDIGKFTVNCNEAPSDISKLNYEIIKLPSHVSPFSSLY